MLNAAIVTPNFSLGGAERWVIQLLGNTDDTRIKWTGLAVSGHGGADENLCKEASRLTIVHSNKVDPARRPKLAHPFNGGDHIHQYHKDFMTAIKKATEDADVIVTWGLIDVERWFRGINKPRVSCSHTTLREEPLRPISGVTHLTACSKAAMAYFDGRPGTEGLPRQVIYNGADESHLQSVIGREAQRRVWDVKKYAVGCLGRQSPEKNYMVLAQAMEHLSPDFMAIYYGRSQMRYDSAAPELLEIQSDRVKCYLPEPHVGDIMSGLDSVVITSHREACSLVLIEAWLMGVPVVTTPVGCIPELRDVYGPMAIETSMDPSPAELAAAIERSVSAEGRMLAAYAQSVARERFTVKAMADGWTTFLESICS